MINALKKNPALYIGLALPLLMLLLFAGYPFISSLVVEAPKYNFIYSTNSFQRNLKFSVNEGKLELEVYNQGNYPIEPPFVYLVDVHSKKNTKVNFVLTNEENLQIPPLQHRKFIVEGVSLKDLDTSYVSPDGYQFVSNYNDNVSLLPLFFGGGTRNLISISKFGRIEKFQTPIEGYWGSQFVGWIIP